MYPYQISLTYPLAYDSVAISPCYVTIVKRYLNSMFKVLLT
ncbi:hypothetical protein [Yersinia phage vB_YenM_P778]